MKRKTNHRRILRIGNKLVESPSAIFRISEGDWLEKKLHITIRSRSFEKFSTYSLWTDYSMNKEENFLPPMIRILNWKRKEDLDDLDKDKNRKFPKIEVELGTIKNSKVEELEKAFISIQEAFKGNNDYVPYKISRERDCAELEIDYEKEYLDFTIYFSNGNQSLEFSSLGNYSNKLIQQVDNLISLLIESIEPIDKYEWKERYYELTEEYLDGKTPEWFYENEMNKKAKS